MKRVTVQRDDSGFGLGFGYDGRLHDLHIYLFNLVITIDLCRGSCIRIG